MGNTVSTPANVSVVAPAPVPRTTELPNDVHAGAARQLKLPDVVSSVVPNTIGSALAAATDATSTTATRTTRCVMQPPLIQRTGPRKQLAHHRRRQDSSRLPVPVQQWRTRFFRQVEVIR